MARTVLPFVGAAIGFWVGGPTGAQVGFALGGVVGNAVDPVKNIGPKIGETGAQTSAEGAPRAIVYGTVHVTGNVIASGPLIKTDVEEEGGGKGGPVNVTERCFRFYAIRICEGPIGGVLRIWEDDKLVYDMRAGTSMMVESAKWMEGNVFYHGNETQMPDVFNTLNIDADSPAYRGTAYMTFGFRDLTDRRGSIPQYRFEVARTMLPPSVEDITDDLTVPVVVVGGQPQHQYVHLNYKRGEDHDAAQTVACGSILSNGWPLDGSAFYRQHEIDDDAAIIDTDLFPLTDGGNWDVAVPAPAAQMLPLASYGQSVLAIGSVYAAGSQLYIIHGGMMTAVLLPFVGASDVWFADNLGADAANGSYAWMDDGGIYLGAALRSGVPINAVYWWPLASAGTAPSFQVVAGGSITNVCATPGAPFKTHLGRDGKLRIINDLGVLSVYSAGLMLEGSTTLPISMSNLSGFGVDDGVAVVLRGGGTSRMEVYSTADWSLIAQFPHATFGLKSVGNRVVFANGSVFMQCQDEVLRAPYLAGSIGEPMLLSDIVNDIHARCDDNHQDVSELTDEVAGLVLAGDYTGADAINTLRGPYFFDKAEANGTIYYPKRGAAVVDTWTIDDLIDEPDTQMREQALEYPKKFHLFYQHANSGYAVVKATSQRSSPDARVVGEATAQVPVVLNEDQAAQTAHKMHKVSWAEAEGEVKFSVPWSFIERVPSNPIGLYLRNRVSRLRITEMALADGVIDVTARHDRQSAYTSNVTGVPIPDPTPPPGTIVGATQLVVLDIPSLRDQDDDLNIYYAVSGAQTAWHGAVVQRSTDDGATWENAALITNAQVIGELVEDLADADADLTDTTNMITVRLLRPNQTLDSISDQAFLSEQGAFAIKDADGQIEILQARDWSEDSNGDWIGSMLHRGRLNTRTNAHLAGATFVMLDRVRHVPMPSALIGQEVTYRAVSLDEAPELATLQTETYTGQSQREWPVASLAASVAGSTLSASWAARHRFGTDDAPVASINFTGFRVTAGNLVDGVTVDQTAQTFTTDVSGFATPYVVSVAALNRITGPGEVSSVLIGGTAPGSDFTPSGITQTSAARFAHEIDGVIVTCETSGSSAQARFFDADDLTPLGTYGVTSANPMGCASVGNISYHLFDDGSGTSLIARFDRTSSMSVPTATRSFSVPITDIVLCGTNPWVASPSTGEVIRLHPSTLANQNVVSAPALQLASDGAKVYASGDASVSIIDNITLAVTSIPLPSAAPVWDMVFAAGKLIVSQENVAALHPVTGAVLATLTTAPGSDALLSATGNILAIYRGIDAPALIVQAANMEVVTQVQAAGTMTRVFALSETKILIADTTPQIEIWTS